MTARKTLSPAFTTRPDQDIPRAAARARAAAAATEPEGPPAALPKFKYALDRKRRVEMVKARTTTLEEQRFNTELDWEQTMAQIAALEADPNTQEAELTGVHNAERQTRLRIISFDAALARLAKKVI